MSINMGYLTGSCKINCEDLRLALNGTFSGSSTGSYTFWGNDIDSGSLHAQIALSDRELRFFLGDSVMDASDTDTSNAIQTLELNYSIFRALTILSGGIVVRGFTYNAGPSVSQPHLFNVWKNLIDEYRRKAEAQFYMLQTFAIAMEAQIPSVSETAPSVM